MEMPKLVEAGAGASWPRARPAVLVALAAGLLVALYAALGTWLAPRLIAREAKAWTERELGLELAIEAVRVDPFRFVVELDGLALPAEAPMVKAERLHLDLAVGTLFARTRRFDAIRLDAPEIRAILGADGRLNLARLVPPESDTPIPSVHVADLAVAGGRALLRDESRESRPETWLDPIGFRLQDFRTDAEGGRFRLDARSARGETLAWRGTLALDPLLSEGEVEIARLEAGTIQDFLGHLLPAALGSGRFAAKLSYRAAYGAAGLEARANIAELTGTGLRVGGGSLLHADVAGSSVRLEGLGLGLQAAPQSEARLEAALARASAEGLELTGTGPARGEALALRSALVEAVELADGAVAVGSVALAGLEATVTRDTGGAISLLRLLPASGAVAPASAAPLPAIGAVRLADARVRFVDRAVKPAQTWTVAPISFEARGSPGGPMAVKGEARVNGATRVALDGSLSLDGPTADLAVSLSGLPLVALVPYTIDYPALELVSGALAAEGRLRYGDAMPRFSGSATIADLELVETFEGTDLLRWRRLALAGIEADTRAVRIARARLEQPYGTLLILADGTLNTQRLVTMNPEPIVTPAAETAGPPVRRGRAERRAIARQQAALRAARAEEARAALAAPLEGPAFPFTVARLEIAGGTLDFADYALRPRFSARIEGIEGVVGNISNDARQVAKVDLKGYVIDRFSPVSIEGELTPFQYDRRTHVDMAFRNIELPLFNPYSGRYAGYAIARGKLSTELGYAIDNRALAATHHIVIDQLEWGAPTESQDRVPLPIRFATALLKDRNGVITLDVPVTGTLDDPEFRMWPIVWKMLGNLMGRVVTAPFRALGGLFGGRENVEFIAFEPGAADLTEAAQANLADIARGLAAKPDLRLDIPAGPALASDARAIADRRLAQAALAREAEKGEPASFEALLGLDPARRLDRLETLYRARRNERPAFPQGPDGEDREARRVRQADWLLAELRADFLPDDAALAALGKARADAIRMALATAEPPVDPARLFLAADASAREQEGQIRTELKLDLR